MNLRNVRTIHIRHHTSQCYGEQVHVQTGNDPGPLRPIGIIGGESASAMTFRKLIMSVMEPSYSVLPEVRLNLWEIKLPCK